MTRIRANSLARAGNSDGRRVGTCRWWRAGWALVLLLHVSGAAAQDPPLPFVWTMDVVHRKLTITPAPRMGLFFETDQITIATTDNGDIRVFGLDGALVYQGPPTARTFARGHYFVETNGDRNQFAVLPADWVPAPMIGVHDTGSWQYGDLIKEAEHPSWERNGRGVWSEVERQPGVYDWSAMDASLAALAGSGRKIIFVGAGGVPGIPAWLPPGNTYAEYTNNFVTAYTNYVAAALDRYGNQLYGFEIFNEPMRATFGITDDNEVAPLYLTLAQAVKVVRDQLAPHVKLVGPSWQGAATGDTPYLLSHGINDILDVWTWHDYDGGFAPPDQDHPLRVSLTHRIQDIYGSAVVNEPSVVGEFALYGRSALGCPPPTDPIGTVNSGIGWYRGYCRSAKTVLLYGAAGVDGIVPHVGASFAQYPDDNIEIYGFDYGPQDVTRSRGPHPKTSALLLSAYWLRNATLVDWRSPASTIFVYAFQGSNNTAMVFAWSKEGVTNTINRAVAPTSTDLFGKTNAPTLLLEEPVRFVSTTLSPAALLSNVLAAVPATSTNLPPRCGGIPNQSVLKGQLLQLDVPATDPDHDPISFAVSPLPAGAALNATAGRFTWTPTSNQVGVYNLTFTVTDARGRSAATNAIVTVLNTANDGLAGWWKLDEATGTQAVDSAGSNTGKLTNFVFGPGSGWGAGRYNGGLQFDGVDDSLGLDGNNSAWSVSNNFTVAAWVNPLSAPGEGVVWSHRFKYGQNGFRLWIAANSVRIEGTTTAGWHANRWALNTIQNGAWYHVAAVYERSVWRVYVNNVLQPIGFSGEPDWGGDFIMNAVGDTSIGSVGPGSYFFKGTLDDVRFYRRTLSAAEINLAYQGANNQPPVLAAIGARACTEGQPLGFTVSGTDPENGYLTYSVTGLPAGATFNGLTRTFAWTPNYTQAGNYNVTFTVSDGALADSETVPITVANGDQPPVLALIGNKRVTGGQTLQFTVSGSDPDNAVLTYSASPLPAGASFNPATRTFAWSPSLSQTGTYQVVFAVSDGTLSDSEKVTITVDDGNRPPQMALIADQNISAGQFLTFTIVATDPDTNQLVYTAFDLPAGATFDTNTHVFAWTPAANQLGTFTVSFEASDGRLSDGQTVAITVTANTGQPPTLAPIGNKTTAEGQPLTFTVSATDPDTATLSYSATGLPAGATFNANTRVFAWTPAAGQAGVYSNVTFAVSDGSHVDSETIVITVTGTGGNQPPVLAAIGNKSVNENAPLSFTVSATDPDGNPLTYSATGLPSGASFNASTRVFTWTPSYTQAGVYSNVIFTVSDGSLSDSEAIVITVANVNRAPVMVANGNKTTGVGQLVSFTVVASDPDGDVLRYTAFNLPAGSTYNTNTQVFAWTPAANQVGKFTPSFEVSDGLLKDGQNVSITVTNAVANQPPVLAAIGNKSVNENAPLSFTVAATDPDGNPLTYSATGLPSGASFNASTRAFTWTPSYTQAGVYSNVIFTVSDGSLSDSEAIVITVANVNRPPKMVANGNKTTGVGQLVSFTVVASDPDGDVLRYTAFNLPAGSTYNTNTQVFAWTPAANQVGKFTPSFEVSDGLLKDGQNVSITVTSLVQGASSPLLAEGAAVSSEPAAFGVTQVVLVDARTGVEVGALTNGAVLDTAALPDVVSLRADTSPATVGSVWFVLDTNVVDLVDDEAPYHLLGDDGITATPWTPTPGAHQLTVTPYTDAAAQGTAGAGLDLSFSVVTSPGDNRAPVLAAIDLFSAVAGTACRSAVSATDADGEPLRYFATGMPAGATFDGTTGAWSWSPALAQVGAYAPTVTVSDGAASATGLVPLLVVDPAHDWLAGATRAGEAVLDERVFVYCWRLKDRTVLVAAWCRPGAVTTLGATPGLTRTDLWYEPVNPTTLGTAPVLFRSARHAVPARVLAQVLAALGY